MSIITEIGAYLDELTNTVGKAAGLTVAIVIAAEKIARCIPTNFNNKPLQVVARFFYSIFAVIGLKAPDIAKIQDGKIVTNIEAIAQEVIDKQPETTVTEPK